MTTPEPQTPEEQPRWWSVGPNPADSEQPTTPGPGPGFHITITPPPAAPVPETPAQRQEREWRAAVRRWLARHGAAALVGWAFGLYDAFAGLVHTARSGGVAAGLAMAAFTYLGGEFLLARFGRFVPPKLRPAAAWACRIPFATALLATALYAPRALQ
ncbi:hypothetical protein [Streptomyces griseosporeus]|uniref:hypothetical protein n=1 Tax=Streptomyces griseosporeus TaxID=1910 RepID=UPI0036FFB08B